MAFGIPAAPAVGAAGIDGHTIMKGRGTMKRIAFLVLILVFAVPAFAGPRHAAKKAAPKPGTVITIHHVSDSHSHVDSFGPKDRRLSGRIGGLAKVATILKKERARGGNFLFFHSGDAFQGDMFFNQFLGVPELDLLNMLGLDAMAVGNHEFDLGPEVLAYALSSTSSPSLFPLVSANLDLTGYPVLQNWITPSITKRVGGVTVGIFGLTVPDDPTNMPEPVVILEDVATIAWQTAATLRAQGAQVVICLSHLGLLYDQAIAENVPGIDFILGGHSHDTLRRPLAVAGPTGGVTLIMHPGPHYKNIGRLQFTVTGGVVNSVKYRLLPVDRRVRPDPVIQSIVDNLKLQITATYGPVYTEVIARAPHEVAKAVPAKKRFQDSPVGNLVTDSYRYITGTELAIAANGFIAEGLPKGKIVGADIFRTVSYGFNPDTGLGLPLAIAEISGFDLVYGLEFGLYYLGLNEDFFLQVSGLQYRYRPDAAPGERVDLASLVVAGEPIDPMRKYTLTVNLGIVMLLPMVGVNLENVQLLDISEYEALGSFASHLGVIRHRSEGRIVQLPSK